MKSESLAQTDQPNETLTQTDIEALLKQNANVDIQGFLSALGQEYNSQKEDVLKIANEQHLNSMNVFVTDNLTNDNTAIRKQAKESLDQAVEMLFRETKTYFGIEYFGTGSRMEALMKYIENETKWVLDSSNYDCRQQFLDIRRLVNQLVEYFNLIAIKVKSLPDENEKKQIIKKHIQEIKLSDAELQCVSGTADRIEQLKLELLSLLAFQTYQGVMLVENAKLEAALHIVGWGGLGVHLDGNNLLLLGVFPFDNHRFGSFGTASMSYLSFDAFLASHLELFLNFKQNLINNILDQFKKLDLSLVSPDVHFTSEKLADPKNNISELSSRLTDTLGIFNCDNPENPGQQIGIDINCFVMGGEDESYTFLPKKEILKNILAHLALKYPYIKIEVQEKTQTQTQTSLEDLKKFNLQSTRHILNLVFSENPNNRFIGIDILFLASQKFEIDFGSSPKSGWIDLLFKFAELKDCEVRNREELKNQLIEARGQLIEKLQNLKTTESNWNDRIDKIIGAIQQESMTYCVDIGYINGVTVKAELPKVKTNKNLLSRISSIAQCYNYPDIFTKIYRDFGDDLFKKDQFFNKNDYLHFLENAGLDSIKSFLLCFIDAHPRLDTKTKNYFINNIFLIFVENGKKTDDLIKLINEDVDLQKSILESLDAKSFLDDLTKLRKQSPEPNNQLFLLKMFEAFDPSLHAKLNKLLQDSLLQDSLLQDSLLQDSLLQKESIIKIIQKVPIPQQLRVNEVKPDLSAQECEDGVNQSDLNTENSNKYDNLYDILVYLNYKYPGPGVNSEVYIHQIYSIIIYCIKNELAIDQKLIDELPKISQENLQNIFFNILDLYPQNHELLQKVGGLVNRTITLSTLPYQNFFSDKILKSNSEQSRKYLLEFATELGDKDKKNFLMLLFYRLPKGFDMMMPNYLKFYFEYVGNCFPNCKSVDLKRLQFDTVLSNLCMKAVSDNKYKEPLRKTFLLLLEKYEETIPNPIVEVDFIKELIGFDKEIFKNVMKIHELDVLKSFTELFLKAFGDDCKKDLMYKLASNGQFEMLGVFMMNEKEVSIKTRIDGKERGSGLISTIAKKLGHSENIDKSTPIHYALEKIHYCIKESNKVGGADESINTYIKNHPVKNLQLILKLIPSEQIDKNNKVDQRIIKEVNSFLEEIKKINFPEKKQCLNEIKAWMNSVPRTPKTSIKTQQESKALLQPSVVAAK